MTTPHLDTADPRRVRELIAARHVTNRAGERGDRMAHATSAPSVFATMPNATHGAAGDDVADDGVVHPGRPDPDVAAFRLAAEVEQLQAERARLLALAAQAFAARPSETRYGHGPQIRGRVGALAVAGVESAPLLMELEVGARIE